MFYTPNAQVLIVHWHFGSFVMDGTGKAKLKRREEGKRDRKEKKRVKIPCIEICSILQDSGAVSNFLVHIV